LLHEETVNGSRLPNRVLHTFNRVFNKLYKTFFVRIHANGLHNAITEEKQSCGIAVKKTQEALDGVRNCG